MLPKNKKNSANKRARPILWIGGRGLPGGAIGRELGSLGHPIHWERTSAKAAAAAATLAPILIVLECERITGGIRQQVDSLAELKKTVDLVMFQLRKSNNTNPPIGVDGVLVLGRGLAQQIRVVLQTIEGRRAFKDAGARAQRRIEKLKSDVQRLKDLAVKDDLTSIYNLRFFNKTLEAEHQRAQRFSREYSLIFLDLDGLREINEDRGHLAGARVLQRIGEYLHKHLRRMDLPARIGGDEFVVICPETSKRAARRVAERLRLGIQGLLDAQGKRIGITASMGVSSFPEDGNLSELVLQRADRALYEAKAQGKNVVCCWGEFESSDPAGATASVHLDIAESDRLTDLLANTDRDRMAEQPVVRPDGPERRRLN